MRFENWCSRHPLFVSCQTWSFGKVFLMHPVLPKLMPLAFFFPPRMDELFGRTHRVSICPYPHSIFHAVTRTEVLKLECASELAGHLIQYRLPSSMMKISDSKVWGWSHSLDFYQDSRGGCSCWSGAIPQEALYQLEWSIVLNQIGAFVPCLKPSHVYSIKPKHWAWAQSLQLFQWHLPPLHLWFRHTKHFPVLLPWPVLSHSLSLHIQSLPGVFLLFLYWADSYSSGKILLKCHFLHETITESFRNRVSLSSPLCSNLKCITLHFDDLFAYLSNDSEPLLNFTLFIAIFSVSLKPSTMSSTKYTVNWHIAWKTG